MPKNGFSQRSGDGVTGCKRRVRALALCSRRWTESSALPDVAADLQRIQRALGIAADQRVDFILIRDDMVARQVTTRSGWAACKRRV